MIRWLTKLLGRNQSPGRVLEVTVDTGPYHQPKSARLLRKVTALKDEGRLEDAISTLRKAYEQIDREGGGQTIETYLRLPMLLQKAGRADEAWAEYNRLLTHDPTGFGSSRELAPMHHSIIYDKMRLFLQREGKPDRAVAFGILSAYSWATGLHYQERFNELQGMRESSNVRDVLSRLLKKASRTEVLEELELIFKRTLDEIPNSDPARLVKQVNEVIVRH